MQINHKLVAVSVLALGFAVGFATASADPDSIVDCSGLARYASDHRYSRGDTAWYPDGAYAHKIECNADSCFKSADNDDPLVVSKKWKIVGRCSKRPD